jgi:drug/metabolite transporter (DMT)-like permease
MAGRVPAIHVFLTRAHKQDVDARPKAGHDSEFEVADMAAPTSMHHRDWALLVLLSILWGGSFFFNGIAIRELPPLTIVLARVAIAAALLLPILRATGATLPKRLSEWWPFLVMGILNNVIPFSLIVAGQTQIASGLASVLNATTPLFTVLVMAGAREEPLLPRRIIGVLMGIAGVIILRGPDLRLGGGETLGILLCLGAALSYGFSGLWGRRKLSNVAPLTSATCQLICSSMVMLMLAGAIERPWLLPAPSLSTWLALLGTAALSTALAYVVFFQILVRSGASNVMLVTLLIPVTAILLGHFILGEAVAARDIIGALVIAGALMIVDGRLPKLLSAARRAKQKPAAQAES